MIGQHLAGEREPLPWPLDLFCSHRLPRYSDEPSFETAHRIIDHAIRDHKMSAEEVAAILLSAIEMME